jgi:hypothetical protein
MRRLDGVVMCDIVKDNALSLQASWTSLMNSMVTTERELEQPIFTRGVHLETKLAASQFETKTGPVAFPGSTDTDDTNSIHDQLVALIVELMSMRVPEHP